MPTDEPRARRRALVTAACLLGVLTSSCAFWRVDAPIILRADRRLRIVAPANDQIVQLPLDVRWEADGFETGGGRYFALFVDRPPLGPNKLMRFRVCGDAERRPISPGEFRVPCREDVDTIKFATQRSLRFDCFPTNFGLPERTRNRHAVTIVLLDEDRRRIGEAAATVNFEITEADARRCRGVA